MLDRRDLYRLYPQPKKKVDDKGTKDSSDFWATPRAILAISLLLTIPLSAIVTMVNYFKQVTNAFNVLSVLPAIIILLIAWVALLIIVLSNVWKELDRLPISNSLFIVIYSLTALPISQLIFNVCNEINHGVIILPFIGILLVENLVAVSLILPAMLAKRIPGILKLVALIVIVLACFVFTILSGLKLN